MIEFFYLSCGGSLSTERKEKRDWEDSALLKVAACIPVLGLVIHQIASSSIEKKFKGTPLPLELRPHSKLGRQLSADASQEVITKSCQRAGVLKSIQRDYTKCGLVNSLLTIALAVYALAVYAIPLAAGVALVAGFAFVATMLTFVLCSDDSIKRCNEISTGKTAD